MINTSRPEQNGCCFTLNSFKYIELNENYGIAIQITLNFVPNGPIGNDQQAVTWSSISLVYSTKSLLSISHNFTKITIVLDQTKSLYRMSNT